jgi:hypothetical protein
MRHQHGMPWGPELRASAGPSPVPICPQACLSDRVPWQNGSQHRGAPRSESLHAGEP